MHSVEVDMLGTLRIRFQDEEAALPGSKMRSLLSVLAFRAGAAVRRDELIEELDLQRATNDPVNALHANMTRLRRWLGANCPDANLLHTVDAGYLLEVDPEQVDAHRFTARVEHALNLTPATPSIVAAVLEDALAMWRGDALRDVFDGPLITTMADDLHQLRAAAREEIAYAWLALGRDQKIVVNGKRYAAEDPLNERLHAAVVISLRRMGRHAEAVEAYDNACRILETELGIGPSPVLRAAVGGEPERGPEPRTARRRAFLHQDGGRRAVGTL